MELFNQPYKTANQKIFRAALRNRKLADQILKQIYDLQVYSAAHGGVITKWVLDAAISASSQSQYVVNYAKIKRELTMAMNSDYLAGRIINLIRELQLIASISPIADHCSYKEAPSHASILRMMISTLANKKFGKLMQEALLELQEQFSGIEFATLTCAANAGGVAGNKTVVGDGIKTFTTLIGAGWTASAGGSEKPGIGVSIAIAGGVNSIPATFGQFSGSVTGFAGVVNANVAGVAGNVTLTADSITDIDALIAAHNLAFPANTLTLGSGLGTQVPEEDIVLSGGAALVPAVAASFSGSKAVVGTTSLSEPLFE